MILEQDRHLLHLAALPIPAEVHARPRLEHQGHHAAHLPPVVHPAVILPPRALLGIAGEVGAADVVVMPLLRPTHPAEEALRPVRAGTVHRVGDLVVDPLDS